MRAASFFPALLVLSCGLTESVEEGPPEAFRSGERLRARVYVPEGAEADSEATKSRISWYDTELDVDCQFGVGIDGTFRCFPAEEIIKVANPSADCDPAQHLAQLPTGVGASCSDRYVSRREWLGDCDGEQHLIGFRIGARVSTGGNDAYGYAPLFSTGECLETTFATEATYSYCAMDEVAQETFVTAREDVRVVGDVEQRVLLGEDGSMQILGLRHPELEVPLYPEEGELVPQLENHGFWSDVYADSECTMEAEGMGQTCAMAVRIDVDECSGGGQTYRIGERVDTFYGLNSEGACGLHPSSATIMESEIINGYPVYHLLGETMPRIDYVERRVGSGRLQNTWVEHGGEAVLPMDVFYDDELGVPCYAGEAEDGSTRCLLYAWGSGNGSWVALYEDAACSEVAGYRWSGSCGAPPPYRQGFETFTKMVAAPTPGALFQWAHEAPEPLPDATSPCVAWTGDVDLYQEEPLETSDLAPLEEALE